MSEKEYKPLVIESDLITSRVSYNTHPTARALLLVERGGVELPPGSLRSPMENDDHLVWTSATLPEVERLIAAAKRVPSVGPVDALNEAANQPYFSPKVSTFAPLAMQRPPAAAVVTPAPANTLPAPRPRPPVSMAKSGGRR